MAFYEDHGDGRFLATRHTGGPWDERFQHGGPPSALLARAMERLAPREELVVARVTVDLLGPIPVGPLEVRADVARPGRSVELLHATMSAGGRDVATAAAWRVRRAVGAAITSRAAQPPPLPEPQEQHEIPGWGSGYLQAMEWRWTTGRMAEPGPAVVWARMREPLVDEEDPSPLSRVMVLADSGNGVSSELDIAQWQFINPELTVHLHREPVGEWLCIDAATTVSDGGSGLATSVLSDVEGPIGVGAQSLLVNRWA